MKLIMVLVGALLAMPTGTYGMDSHNRYVIRSKFPGTVLLHFKLSAYPLANRPSLDANFYR